MILQIIRSQKSIWSSTHFNFCEAAVATTFKSKDFLNLTKFSLSNSNAILTTFCYAYASQEFIDPILASQLYVASLSMAMSTQVFNQLLEWRQDQVMTRTCNRPIPRKKISTLYALLIGSSLFAFSNWLFYKYMSRDSHILANSIFVGYVCMYSPMKRQHQINTKIGALVGALPILLGAAAYKEKDYINIQSLSMLSFMFAWQFNHFYGIYWMYQQDYQRAGFKMLNDHIKAAREMKLMCLLTLASWLGLAYTQDKFVMIPTALGGFVCLYLWNWKAILEFEQSPNKKAKSLKMNSYKYFTFFFGSALVDWALKMGKYSYYH